MTVALHATPLPNREKFRPRLALGDSCDVAKNIRGAVWGDGQAVVERLLYGAKRSPMNSQLVFASDWLLPLRFGRRMSADAYTGRWPVPRTAVRCSSELDVRRRRDAYAGQDSATRSSQRLLPLAATGRCRPFSDRHGVKKDAAKQSLVRSSRGQPCGKLAPERNRRGQTLHDLHRRHHHVRGATARKTGPAGRTVRPTPTRLQRE